MSPSLIWIAVATIPVPSFPMPSVVLPANGQLPAVLIREAACNTAQHELFSILLDAVRGTQESAAMSQQSCSSDRPIPLCVWQHPYTRQTNAKYKPQALFDWAHALADHVAGKLQVAHHDAVSLSKVASSIDNAKYDSLVSILYSPTGSLAHHVDTGMQGYGMALSLGAHCTFDFGGTEIQLRSGDVLFADFGHIEHAVLCTAPASTAPQWWQTCSPFFARCSVQLRDRAWSSRPHPTQPGIRIRRTVRLRES